MAQGTDYATYAKSYSEEKLNRKTASNKGLGALF